MRELKPDLRSPTLNIIDRYIIPRRWVAKGRLIKQTLATMDKKQEEQLEEWKRYREAYPQLPWRAWGSWYSWGSATGLGLFLISIGVFILLLHLAGLY